MWWRIRQWMAEHVTSHAVTYAVLIFIMIVGLSAGTATARTMAAGTDRDWALTELTASFTGGWTAFWSALWLGLRLLLVTALCTLGWGGTLPAGLVLALRGYLSGFSMGLMVCALGAWGWLVVLLALLPAATLMIAAQLVSSAIAVELALLNLRSGFRMSIVQKLQYHLNSYIAMLALFMIALAAAAFEAGVAPLLMSWITAKG